MKKRKNDEIDDENVISASAGEDIDVAAAMEKVVASQTTELIRFNATEKNIRFVVANDPCHGDLSRSN